jgi:hypothetical protein
MGKVITSEPQYTEITRSWLDEWAIARTCQQKLEDLGFDPEQSASGVTIIKLLVDQQLWVDTAATETPASLFEGWLSKEVVRSFLKINRYRGKLWFNKEAFESMVWWMTTIGLIQLVSDPEESLTSAIEKLFEAWDLVKGILEAEEGSEYQLEKLLDGLK